jgi:hypothetical protein
LELFYNLVHVREGAHGEAYDFLAGFNGVAVSEPLIESLKAWLRVQRLRVVDAVRNFRGV